jgi:hypothetical protein
MKKTIKMLLLTSLLASVGLFVGCQTSAESQNLSERPWNAPSAGFGNGLPMDFNRGR